MTLVSDIITRAYRENNLIPVGRTPTTAEQDEALVLLNSYVDMLFGRQFGEFVYDWAVPPSRTAPVAADFPLKPLDTDLPRDVWPYPPPNVRLVTRLTSNATVYLPPYPSDGARLAFVDTGSTANINVDGNGRLFNGLAFQSAPATSLSGNEYFYRAEDANWVLREPMTLTGQSIFADEWDDLLVTGLNMRLSPRYAQPVADATQAIQNMNLARMRAKYHQDTPAPFGFDPVLMSRQAHPRRYDYYGGDLL